MERRRCGNSRRSSLRLLVGRNYVFGIETHNMGHAPWHVLYEPNLFAAIVLDEFNEFNRLYIAVVIELRALLQGHLSALHFLQIFTLSPSTIMTMKAVRPCIEQTSLLKPMCIFSPFKDQYVPKEDDDEQKN